MLGHVAAALQTGKTAPAVQAIGAHLGHLARTYGVPVSMPSARATDPTSLLQSLSGAGGAS
jgi:hypothetical protein